MELEVLGEATEDDAGARLDVPEADEPGEVDRAGGAGDRVAVRAGGGVAEQLDEAALDLVGDHLLPPDRLLVGAVPGEPEDPDQEVLDQPVAADQALGQAPAGLGERQAPPLVHDEPVADQPLHGLRGRGGGHAQPLRQTGLDEGDTLLAHLIQGLEVRRRGVLRRDHGPKATAARPSRP